MRTEFERISPAKAGIDPAAIEWLLDRLEEGDGEPHGLMIMRHGKICAEGWWAPYAPGIRHGQQSHSKTYTATAIGIAYTEGILSLEERLVDIFPDRIPEHPSENLKKLRVRDVLCMGCGMDEMPVDSEEWVRDFLAIPVNHEPGTAFMYNTAGSTVLGAIIREKTGLGLQEYLKPRLYDKIGIVSDNHRWLRMSDGIEAGGGGLFCTTEDNLRLMKLYADGGVWDGERILAEDYVRQAVGHQIDSVTQNLLAKDNFLGYGFQIWMCAPKGAYRADGAMGQFTIVIPDKDMIIAINENASGGGGPQRTLDLLWQFLDRIHEDVIPEDPDADTRLKNRLARLSLPRARYMPVSPLTEKINGRKYSLKEGLLPFDPYGFGRQYVNTLTICEMGEFSLDFECDRMILAGGDTRIVFAMDGSRRYNEIGDGLIRQALCSAYFAEEDELVLLVRWIETCNEQKFQFHFCDREIQIKVRGTMMGAEKTLYFTAQS
ncbi:MAG: beta-lactamase family protein [Lachnospiraceae bacterium]|nr:beta-lactamase family protein [Lachnospiraceae bacterium]